MRSPDCSRMSVGITESDFEERSHCKGAVACPEMSVRNYRYSLRNNPEDCSSHLVRGGRAKSHKIFEVA